MVHQSPYQDGGKGPKCNLAVFAVADGHNGSAAALHCQELLYSELMRHMPASSPPMAPGTQGAARPSQKNAQLVKPGGSKNRTFSSSIILSQIHISLSTICSVQQSCLEG